MQDELIVLFGLTSQFNFTSSYRTATGRGTICFCGVSFSSNATGLGPLSLHTSLVVQFIEQRTQVIWDSRIGYKNTVLPLLTANGDVI